MSYEVIDVEQGSAEWLALRKSKITATDTAVIMGLNPWKTPLMLWEEKLGLREPAPINDKMREGSLMEEQAREFWNKRLGIETSFKPVVLVSNTYQFMMASLDGLNPMGEILEIKCGAKSHEMAKEHGVAPYYFAQIQKQMFVSGKEYCWLLSYRSDDDFIHFTIERDDVFIEKMIEAEKDFYRRMVEFDPPTATDKDYAISNDKELIFKLKVLSSLKKQLKDITSQISDLEDTIIEECKSVSTKAENFKITKCTRRGNVDYSRIEILKSVNLDDYRKPSTQYFRISET